MRGDIELADRERGVGVRVRATGELFSLPPDLKAIRVAPGEYRFKSTGAVVVDPSLMAIWTLTKPRKH